MSAEPLLSSPDALLDSVASGAIAPLRAKWLIALHDRGGRLRRRQELPPEAFVDVGALRAAHAALPPHIAQAVVPVVSISYCWLAANHPDETGEQLRHVV